MKLADYLKSQSVSEYAFANRIGVHPSTVGRLCKAGALPTKEVAQRIFNSTDGRVTPDDFYELESK